ncbi:T-lymphocyte activation antigen CD80-like [Paroedura picta]|uniref:T-lymphocyte activation antigen CD80-like n=1 Tax=Paroedura picta TaxID=143630 RepID=UPI0040573D6C
MMHTIQNTKLMLSRPGFKGFFWLGFFTLHFNITGMAQMTTVKAKVREVATLPCDNNIHLDTSLKHYNVYWQKDVGSGHEDLVVFAYWKGNKLKNDAKYMNRTTMDQQNFTLWIAPVKVSDEGKYKCIILKNTSRVSLTTLSLTVMAEFSKPVIEMDPPACGSTLLILTCSSHGGYPKPTMTGLLNNNKVEWDPISTSDNQTQLFNITSNFQHNVTEDVVFLCSVSSPGFQTSTSYNYTIPKECPVEKPLLHWIAIVPSVIVCIGVVVALANIQCCKRHESLSHTTSHQPVARREDITGAALTPLQFFSQTSGK